MLRDYMYIAVGWLAFFLIAPVVFWALVKALAYWVSFVYWWWHLWL